MSPMQSGEEEKVEWLAILCHKEPSLNFHFVDWNLEGKSEKCLNYFLQNWNVAAKKSIKNQDISKALQTNSSGGFYLH
jgi:hypothetical protein